MIGPTVLIVLMVFSAFEAAFRAHYWMAIYWIAAAVLNMAIIKGQA